MTLRLCYRMAKKGPVAWIALYWPQMVLISYCSALYAIFMYFDLIPKIRSNANYAWEIFFVFHTLFGMFVYNFFLVWSSEAGFVHNVCL